MLGVSTAPTGRLQSRRPARILGSVRLHEGVDVLADLILNFLHVELSRIGRRLFIDRRFRTPWRRPGGVSASPAIGAVLIGQRAQQLLLEINAEIIGVQFGGGNGIFDRKTLRGRPRNTMLRARLGLRRSRRLALLDR